MMGSTEKLSYLKNLVPEKVSEPVSEKFGTGKKSRNRYRKNWYRYRYRKYLVPEKSIGIGIVEHFGYRHTLQDI